MAKFNVGDRVVLKIGSRSMVAPDGTKATVTHPYAGTLTGKALVTIKWDEHKGRGGHRQMDGNYFEDDFVLEDAPLEGSVEKHPEDIKQELFDKWVVKLQEFAESDTRVEPYSSTGFLAQFLIEWEAAK